MNLRKTILNRNNIIDITSCISIIAALISVLVYLISSRVGWNIDGISILLTLLASISLFIITNTKKSEIVNDAINQISNNVNAIKIGTDNLNQISNDVKAIKTGTPALIIGINNQHDFYCHLNEKVLKSTNRVWLTHLDQWAPISPKYTDLDRVNYFDSVLQYAKNHEEIDFKRIISIPNEEKLAWVEKLINDSSSHHNLNFAYIKIDDIETLFPTSVVSCQIIDFDKMFILNPLLNRVPRTRGKFKDCLYFENRKIVEVYADYYDKLWDELSKKNCSFGCLLKDGNGTDLFYSKKNMILDHIKTYENKQSKADGVRDST